jgi:hypothetical protein
MLRLLPEQLRGVLKVSRTAEACAERAVGEHAQRVCAASG